MELTGQLLHLGQAGVGQDQQMCKIEVELGREHSKGSSPALSQPQEEAGQVLLLKGGVYWDSPSTAVPALEDVMICKNLSASLNVCSRSSAAAKCAQEVNQTSQLVLTYIRSS